MANLSLMATQMFLCQVLIKFVATKNGESWKKKITYQLKNVGKSYNVHHFTFTLAATILETHKNKIAFSKKYGRWICPTWKTLEFSLL